MAAQSFFRPQQLNEVLKQQHTHIQKKKPKKKREREQGREEIDSGTSITNAEARAYPGARLKAASSASLSDKHLRPDHGEGGDSGKKKSRRK
jgi:hypothetical protein